MYQSYFGLSAAPFSIAPDPHYLYMSQRHQEALAHLLYGIHGAGGFVLLTGEIGAGKTTVCRCLLEQLPETCDVAYIFNPRLTALELLATICAEFHIEVASEFASIKQYVDVLNTYLLNAHACGRQSLLIIDEAQNLSSDVLEQMRLLTNLETSERKLLQIILIGQPELQAMLAQPELKQLAQRIVARYHLGSLNRQEVGAYVQHRLEVAGTQRQLFSKAALNRIHRLSGGIPRLINLLCDRALLGAYVQGKERVDRATLAQAAREVTFHSPPRRTAYYLAVGLVASMVLMTVTYRAILFPSEMAADGVHSGVVKSAPPQEFPAVLDSPVYSASLSDQKGALSALFKVWGMQYRDGDSCQQLEVAGLHCQVDRGGLDDLRRINLPAILTLRDRADQVFSALLTGLDSDSATFVVNSETRTVALNALATQWDGQYTFLWRKPAEARGEIKPGSRGAEVAWLAEQLARLHGMSIKAPDTLVYDESLMWQVKQFQLAQGLVPDGVTGSLTLLRLSAATDPTAPRLFAVKGER